MSKIIRDPICGMTITSEQMKDNELKLSKYGMNFIFCNISCKKIFLSQKWYQTSIFSNIFPFILGTILILSGILSIITNLMLTYMGIFFVIFSLAKLLDLSGFIKAFSEYDIIAKRSRMYSQIYPGIELLLGLLYIFNSSLNSTLVFSISLVTMIIMIIGIISVSKSIASKNQIKCACLGTKINFPLTKITLIEYIIMSLMSSKIVIAYF